MIRIEQIIRNNFRKLKGIVFKVYLQIHGCKVGTGLKCYTFPNLRAVPKSNITIGNNVTFGINCTLEVTNKGYLNIANGVNITQNVIISSNARIQIGECSLIGENVSIRDSNHGIALGETIQNQATTSAEVIIGKDVWICANTIILKGSQLSDGSVVGANSLVNSRSKIEQNKIYAGSPVSYIKDRQ